LTGGILTGGVLTGGVLKVAAGAASYRGPVPSPMRVVRAFQPPLQKYGAGHLGVDLAAAVGSPVLAAGAGTVRFAGSVAGRGVVVIVHPDGISTEYEPVRGLVHTGQQVVAGQRIGVVLGSHRGCPVSGCLHWGARRGEDYLDPLGLLQPLGVVRLLPWNYQGPLG
jgi:murein DD-endopeptidase MepM/ murein hydrolase activator NlpD